MKLDKLFLLFVLIAIFALATISLTVACGDDDDDDDDDSAGDDDDDTAGDDDDDDNDTGGDDDDDTNSCSGYDVIIEGETQMDATTVSEWVAYLYIDDATGDITGMVTPPTGTPYDVTGKRSDATSGEIRGSFPTPDEFSSDCTSNTVWNQITFTVTEGAFEGIVEFFCLSIAQGNEIGDPRPATGSVTCGSFAD